MRTIIVVIVGLVAFIPILYTLYVIYASLTDDIKRSDLKLLAKVIVGVAFLAFFIWMFMLFLSPSKGEGVEVDDINQHDLTW